MFVPNRNLARVHWSNAVRMVQQHGEAAAGVHRRRRDSEEESDTPTHDSNAERLPSVDSSPNSGASEQTTRANEGEHAE
jgi:hypothetical protein